MMGYDAGFKGLGYDVAAAKALLAEAGYGPGGSPLKIVVTLPGSAGEMSSDLTAVLYQWQVNLGAEVEVRQLDGDAYFDRLDEEKDDVFFFGWSADYPDPQDFLDVLFRSGSVNNAGEYNSAAYDTLLDQAAVEPNAGVRATLYRQAEAKLVAEDAACLPLWFGKSYLLIKPRVEGIHDQPAGVPAAGQRVGIRLRWIPACAGMTRVGAAECCREFEGVPQSFPFFNPPRLGARGLKGIWYQAYSTCASATA